MSAPIPTRILDTLASSRTAATVARLQAGAGPLLLYMYAVALPDTPGAAISAAPIATAELDRATVSAAGRQVSIAPPADPPMALAGATLLSARLVAADGAPLLEGEVGDDVSAALVRIVGGTTVRAGDLLVIRTIRLIDP